MPALFPMPTPLGRVGFPAHKLIQRPVLLSSGMSFTHEVQGFARSRPHPPGALRPGLCRSVANQPWHSLHRGRHRPPHPALSGLPLARLHNLRVAMPTPMAPGILSAKGDALSLTVAVSAFSLIARCGVAYLRACRRPPGSTAFHRDYPDDPLGSACPPVRHEAGWCPLTKPRGGRDRLLKSDALWLLLVCCCAF